MNQYRTPWPWEPGGEDDAPRRGWHIESYFGLFVKRVELCPDCTPDDPKAVIVVNDLCPPCRLAVEHRGYGS